ncbi:phytoene desaturase family protein [Terrimonas ferruginea]|uniref:phytoene desaturase family protein n=1 Tax=Terrimonas ferruginea TaxID=249 RepID=UPI0003FAA74C|nr:NAD(P)/FAD-dependent oxidoreductase [Terrimonas ferruginea]
MQTYDVVITGSGMGGLVCANLLAAEGLKVCVLEKNNQAGGNLQTFVRDKLIFDSGVHYIGGLGKGQNLYQIFRYLGIMDELRIEQMDPDGFDKILIGNDPKVYNQAQGYESFIRNLAKEFPGEENNIQRYCDHIRYICAQFPLYNLQMDGGNKTSVMSEGAEETIASFTSNPKLRAILAGNNLLYAGEGGRTPFYVHALILNSYIESSWKCIRGGSQIAKQLIKQLRAHGGELFRHTEVTRFVCDNDKVTHVETNNGSFAAKQFISNISPVHTLAMTDSPLLKEVYRQRINHLPNTIASFSVHLVLQEQTVPYSSGNYYYHREGRVWSMNDYTQEDWPLGYGMFYTRSEQFPAYAESITVFTGMHYSEMEPWKESFHTVAGGTPRGEAYELFKKRKGEQLLDRVEERFPGLRKAIKACYTTTPLTYRDYIGSGDGTMYGFAKDYNDPLKTFMSPRTKLPNLYLTGQNLNLHGILGTALSGIMTSITLLGDDKIVEKIRNA